MQIRKLFSAAFFSVAGLLLTGLSPAQAAFPDKPITLIVPFAPGGPTDITGRALAAALAKSLKTSVSVENIGGSGGAVGSARVAKSKPDGYTLLFTHTGLAAAEAFNPKLPFSVLHDLAYLGVISEVPLVLISRPSLPSRNFSQLLDWIQQNEGNVTMANAGIGSTSHLCALMFSDSIKTRIMNVSYKGVGPAMNDILGGQIDVMCDQTISSTPLIESKGVRAYAVTSAKRLDLPEVLKATPTLVELGLASVNITVWQALYAPKDTPPDVLAQLNRAVREILRTPDFVDGQRKLGAMPVDDERLTPDGHRSFMKSEMLRWCEVIRKSDAAQEEGWRGLKCTRR
jgi:tripartite-type tricarboxylate transporter receptor subunit TctC